MNAVERVEKQHEEMEELEREALREIAGLRSNFFVGLALILSAIGGLAVWADSTHVRLDTRLQDVEKAMVGSQANQDHSDEDIAELKAAHRDMLRRFGLLMDRVECRLSDKPDCEVH